jgi:hypothetical protein
MDGHERELMNLPAYDLSSVKRARGLLKRKLLTTEVYRRKDSKNIMCIYTTKLGRNYLATIK